MTCTSTPATVPPVADDPVLALPASAMRRELLEGKGYFVVRGILSPREIEQAKRRLRQVCEHPDYYRQHLSVVRAVDDASLLTHPDALCRFDWINEITYRDAVLWELLAAHPKLVEVACAVVGPMVFPVNGGGFFLKPPGSPAGVPWHQDASPFCLINEQGEAISNPLLFDFWLGLDAGTEENGCLRVIPGSQHRGRLEHRHQPGKMLAELDLAELGYSEDDIVSIPTEPGDLIVWHQDMIHGSEPNRSNRQRIGLASVYMGAAEEITCRAWFSKFLELRALHKYRPPIALHGKPMPLDIALPPPF